jgi:hypothetical protein
MAAAFCVGCGVLVLAALPPFLLIAAHLILGHAPDID